MTTTLDLVLLSPATHNIFPSKPSRERVCGINIQFQGLIVTIDGIKYPWFETALQCLSYSQRQQVYPQLRSAGNTHGLLEFLPGGSIYNEPGQPYQNFISPDFESDPQSFLSLVEEVIINMGGCGVIFNGDNGDNPSDGYPNALRQLPILVSLLESSRYDNLNGYVLYLRFWDGVFYGSSPANIQSFGTSFRAINPDGYLGIEHNVGHIPVGGGTADYLPGGRMDAYDVIFSEFNENLPHNDAVWQVVGRCVNPYHRPSDQPAGDDPNPPFYLVDSPRGNRYYCAFEWNEYEWVRVDTNNYQTLQNQIISGRNYLRSLGCSYTG